MLYTSSREHQFHTSCTTKLNLLNTVYNWQLCDTVCLNGLEQSFHSCKIIRGTTVMLSALILDFKAEGSLLKLLAKCRKHICRAIVCSMEWGGKLFGTLFWMNKNYKKLQKSLPRKKVIDWSVPQLKRTMSQDWPML